MIHYSDLFHDKYNSIIYPFKIFIRVNWITCTIWTAGLIYFYLNRRLASDIQDWLQWKGQYFISNNKNHKLSIGQVKLKPVTKQDEATKLILKQLEFINMLMKYLTEMYKLLVSYFSNFFWKTIILWAIIKQLKKSHRMSQNFFIIAVSTR